MCVLCCIFRRARLLDICNRRPIYFASFLLVSEDTKYFILFRFPEVNDSILICNTTGILHLHLNFNRENVSVSVDEA